MDGLFLLYNFNKLCVYKNTDSLGMVFVILCTSSDVGAIAQKCDELSYILNERRP